MLSHNSAVLRIVHSESPWTKDTSGRRNFLRLDASGRLIFCAQMHADAHRCTQTQTHARGRTQTHAKIFSCILCPSCCMFRPWVSLPANPCSMLVAFQDPEIQLALDRFRNPAHKLTALTTSVFLGDLAWFLDMFYWVVLAVQWSLSHVDSLHLINTVES